MPYFLGRTSGTLQSHNVVHSGKDTSGSGSTCNEAWEPNSNTAEWLNPAERMNRDIERNNNDADGRNHCLEQLWLVHGMPVSMSGSRNRSIRWPMSSLFRLIEVPEVGKQCQEERLPFSKGRALST